MKPLILSLLAASTALSMPVLVHAHGVPQTPATLVAVSVEVDGRQASLYPAPDGSGRYYLEARAGSRYAVALANRTGERVGVVLTVDGLNAVSGERDAGRGRMYVLDPWQSTTVQGWRSSLQEVRQFTFVDERRSYAARAGKANEKMGWIEVAVYRERRPFVQARPFPYWEPLPGGEPRRHGHEGGSAEGARTNSVEEQQNQGRAQAPAAPGASAGADAGEAHARRESEDRAGSYPGTGWGRRTHDPVVLVSFDPEPEAYERIALRYEYRSALVALGVLPPRTSPRDRLWQREHAEPGFAQPPAW